MGVCISLSRRCFRQGSRPFEDVVSSRVERQHTHRQTEDSSNINNRTLNEVVVAIMPCRSVLFCSEESDENHIRLPD